VVIPTRTSEYKIIPCLESLIHQTYKNLEIIVVDDHGENATKGIVADFIKRDPRVKYFLNPGRNLPKKNWRGYDINAGFSARDYGFSKATGGWVTTQDADDASLLNRIETQYRFAEKYNATMVAIQWCMRKPEYEGKQLDVDALIAEKGDNALVVSAEEITMLARRARGVLMQYRWHKYIPFPFKWFPYTRKLFYRTLDTYPGADNSILFRREVLTQARFRSRNERVWGHPSGRGSGRDFTFQVADIFGHSIAVKLPLYLWSKTQENLEYPSTTYGDYIK
jgi:glycosyltransferase involved in cell wall biosynthesis